MEKKRVNTNVIFFVKWMVVPLILFLLGLVLIARFVYIMAEPTVVLSNHSKQNFTAFKTGELHKGNIVRGEIKAPYDYLGIISVRFVTFTRINNDSLIFRIKEKGAKDWFYSQSYKVDQFQPNQHFTFGFPTIADSAGKTYIFELESVQGKRNDAVAISTKEPVIVAKYHFPKSEILASGDILKKFVVAQIHSLVANPDYLSTLLFYFLPLMVYLLWHLLRKKIISQKYVLIGLFILASIVHSLLVDNLDDAAVLLMIPLLFVMLQKLKIQSSQTYLISFAYIGVILLIAPANHINSMENLMMWAVLFMAIAGLQYAYSFFLGKKGLQPLS